MLAQAADLVGDREQGVDLGECHGRAEALVHLGDLLGVAPVGAVEALESAVVVVGLVGELDGRNGVVLADVNNFERVRFM